MMKCCLFFVLLINACATFDRDITVYKPDERPAEFAGCVLPENQAEDFRVVQCRRQEKMVSCDFLVYGSDGQAWVVRVITDVEACHRDEWEVLGALPAKKVL